MQKLKPKNLLASSKFDTEKFDTKKWLKESLKKLGKDRSWLAEKCCVTHTTVDDWFKSRGTIPRAKLWLALMSIREEEKQQEIVNKSITLTLRFTEDQWQVIEEFQQAFPNVDLEKMSASIITNIADNLSPSSHDKIHSVARS